VAADHAIGGVIRRHGVKAERILHVGAHIGQEADCYRDLGAADVVWVEGDPEVIPRLRDHVEPRGQRVVEALLDTETRGAIEFHRASNEMSSSLLAMGTHSVEHPEITTVGTVRLPTTTLDAVRSELALGEIDLLVVDVQGAELRVLRGGEETLAAAAPCYLEVNEAPVYEGCALLPEVEGFMDDHGFVLAECTMGAHGYGDALFLRRSRYPGARRAIPDDDAAASEVPRVSPRRGPRHWVGQRFRGVVVSATEQRFASRPRAGASRCDRVCACPPRTARQLKTRGYRE